MSRYTYFQKDSCSKNRPLVRFTKYNLLTNLIKVNNNNVGDSY